MKVSMPKHCLVRLTAACALAVVLSGCMSFNPRSLRQMEHALRDSNPELEFEPTMKFGVGAMTMNLVDFAFVHESNVDVSKISRADIGVYELTGRIDIAGFKVPPGNERNCPQRDVIIRVVEDDQQVEIAVCSRKGELTGFSMFVLEPAELVVINARGDVQALVASAIRGQGHTRRGAGITPGDTGSVAHGIDVHTHVDTHDAARPEAGRPQS